MNDVAAYLGSEVQRGVDPIKLGELGYPVSPDGTIKPVDADTVDRIRLILEPNTRPYSIPPGERALALAAIRGIRERLNAQPKAS